MKTYNSIERILEDKTVIALGIFDGVHRGHKEVIRKTVDKAKQLGAVPCLLTFATTTACPAKKEGQRYISSITTKLKKYEELGIEKVFMPEFSDIKNMNADSFVEEILIKKLSAKHLVCGYDFHYGIGAKGNSKTLIETASRFDCGVTVVDKQSTDDGQPISSTRIRELLKNGDIELANELLGHPYSIDFVVVKGKQLGREMGFPTINQEYPDNLTVPKFGAYASMARVNGKLYPAVTNVGVKPTVSDSNKPLAETNIIGCDEDLYGKSIEVSFFKYLRVEQKFDGIESLKTQIAEDVYSAEKIFEKISK